MRKQEDAWLIGSGFHCPMSLRAGVPQLSNRPELQMPRLSIDTSRTRCAVGRFGLLLSSLPSLQRQISATSVNVSDWITHSPCNSPMGIRWSPKSEDNLRRVVAWRGPIQSAICLNGTICLRQDIMAAIHLVFITFLNWRYGDMIRVPWL